MSSPLPVDWVSLYIEDLHKWARHKTSSSEVASDLVQDTFLAAAEKFCSFKGESSPKTWLFSILNHKITDYYRKKIKQPVSIDNDSLYGFFDKSTERWNKEMRPGNWNETDGHLLDNDEFQSIFKLCMDALPEKWSTCVKLKYLTEKKGEEICQDLEISPTNFWQIIHRAKLQLRDCIENGWFKHT